jgi:hypothetical protein
MVGFKTLASLLIVWFIIEKTSLSESIYFEIHKKVLNNFNKNNIFFFVINGFKIKKERRTILLQEKINELQECRWM